VKSSPTDLVRTHPAKSDSDAPRSKTQ